MPKSKTTRRRSLPAHTSRDGTTSPDLLDRDSDLSFRQQSALPAVALSPSLAQAAQATGIGKSTLTRWMNDPVFRSEVTRIRQEAANLACQELQGMTLRAASVINSAMDDADPVIRLRAARYTLSFAASLTQISQLASEIKDLREALDSLDDLQ